MLRPADEGRPIEDEGYTCVNLSAASITALLATCLLKSTGREAADVAALNLSCLQRRGAALALTNLPSRNYSQLRGAEER
jgi:hypothetical protein